ncbi:hypothetical protein D043_2670A, partial [Vibrio parahaemolyticus EKP-021]
MGKLRQLR